MAINILTKDACILVASSMDEHSDRLIQAAGQLAVLTGLKVKLLSVVDFTPTQMVAFGNEFGIPAFDAEVLHEKESKALAECSSRLETQRRRLPPGVEAQIKAVSSPWTAEAIAAEAVASQAALVLCGAGGRGFHLIPAGFSTPLTLMANASTPVMVLRHDVPFEVGQHRTRLLVADDLRHSGQAALDFALSFAQRVKTASIQHVFVNQLNMDAFSNALRIMSEPAHPSVSEGEVAAVYEATREKILQKMEARAGKLPPQSQLEYDICLRTGDVAEEIGNAAERFNPDLIIFGRHIKLHHRPFAIGAVPFKVMLRQNFPVVSVPA